MPEVSTPHPSPQQLADFNLGKLAGGDSAVIAGHLLSCPECRARVDQHPPDSFVGELRAAGRQGSTLPPEPPADARRAQPPGDQPAVAAEAPAELLASGKYEVLGKLGEGGMGSVWKAKHGLLDCLVAIKVMSPGSAGHPEAQARFLQEMRAVGKLQHRNIVRAFDAEREGGRLFIVMEYVEGVNLDRLVRERGPLPV